jgi:adenine-specific DNA methylase
LEGISIVDSVEYPKRLIEVDLPIRRISEHSQKDKSVRQGHIQNMHIWWARRPLAACRAVLCAALWPDPADKLCPDIFLKTARTGLIKWANDHIKLSSTESAERLLGLRKDPAILDDPDQLRVYLLDFVADFSNWENSGREPFISFSNELTASATRGLELGDSKPLVVDPFCGGGAIPLEALRVGGDCMPSAPMEQI